MLGVRASPSGRYILVLLRAAPSEVWTVRAFCKMAMPACHIVCWLGCATGRDRTARQLQQTSHSSLIGLCHQQRFHMQHSHMDTMFNSLAAATLPQLRCEDCMRSRESQDSQGPYLIRLQSRLQNLRIAAQSCLCGKLQVGGSDAPRRLRVLDLPFSAVEWALPGDAPQLAPEGLPPDRWALFARSPLARERSMTGSVCRRLCMIISIDMLTLNALA
jgi:hypothetical protein